MSEEINEGAYGSPQPEDEVPTGKNAGGENPEGEQVDEGEEQAPASNGPVRERPEDDYR